MKRSFALAVACLGLALSVPASAPAQTVPFAMNFQGRLAKPDGTPVADISSQSISLRLYSTATGGFTQWGQASNVPVRNGIFSVRLDFSTGYMNGGSFANVFNGNPVYLEMQVGHDAPLTPRQQLVSNAYAFASNLAFSVADGSITSAKIANGAVGSSQLASGVFNTVGWLLGGNSGTNPASQFLGTTDSQPLVIKVNGFQAMRYQYAENTSLNSRSINVLGGSSVNSIASNVIGATISGGGNDAIPNSGATASPNTISTSANFASIGGGLGNKATYEGATVAGGENNTSGFFSTVVGGGMQNTSNGYASLVGGGFFNTASGGEAVVSGGYSNKASGNQSTVPGGQNNIAAGNFSFAGGQNAQANHDGVFVWNDASNQAAAFASTGINQFLIHANGGVGINTNSPGGYALHVAGTGKFDGNLTVNSTTYTSDARYKTQISNLDDPLGVVARLRGVSYLWDRQKWPTRGFAEGRQIGFLAQEVETVLPELVVTDKDGYKSVNYVAVVPVLVEAVKQQQRQISALQADNQELKRQNAHIEELERRLNALLTTRPKQ